MTGAEGADRSTGMPVAGSWTKVVVRGWGAVDIETFVIGAVDGAVVGGLVVYWLGRRRRSG